jgi:hypothetical protein
MLIAKIIDETISIADYRAMFPNTSFPSSGPPDDFLTENNCYKVSVWLPYNDKTEKLVTSDPYLMDNFVYTVKTQTLSEEEIAANSALELQILYKDVIAQTQLRLDTFAGTRNYDSMLSACTYATSTVVKFKTEGQYCVEARDSTWAKLYEILDEVQAGVRPVPESFADIEPDLPELTWPQ